MAELRVAEDDPETWLIALRLVHPGILPEDRFEMREISRLGLGSVFMFPCVFHLWQAATSQTDIVFLKEVQSWFEAEAGRGGVGDRVGTSVVSVLVALGLVDPIKSRKQV
jgi:hypothetical protein